MVMKTNDASLSCDQPCREILFLDPTCTHNIWGGNRLREEFGYPVEGDDIGECWGISAHPNGESTVRCGRFAGQKLSEVWRGHPEIFGSPDSEEFPLLTKIIDARDNLSIQVHPDDAYAKEHENGASGKTESWYILDCPEDARLVIGHNATTREELAAMIHEGRWWELIREIPVKKGDFLQIDPGTVHAIKGGILLLEIQQSSDITYRVYDYDRLSDGKPRKLHVQQSIDVITVPAKPVTEVVTPLPEIKENQLQTLYSGAYYRVLRMYVNGMAHFGQEDSFLCVSVVEGSGIVSGQPVKKGDHFILPHGFGEVQLQGQMQIIASAAQ